MGKRLVKQIISLVDEDPLDIMDNIVEFLIQFEGYKEVKDEREKEKILEKFEDEELDRFKGILEYTILKKGNKILVFVWW